ncbi:hypothetical protein ACHAWO_003198 [Cyclotella atomus]|uniref:Helix-turn-helix domain-containing protein n=1 Tax=Cyclotella atomus TaxID=382360 RepID=A0ABD3Q9E3_9STRA
MAFHDLTPDQSAPPNCKQLFGLGTKFIPTPPKTTGRRDLARSYERFDRDFRLKVYFAGDDDLGPAESDHRSKLYVKSTWTPPDQLTPSWAITRVNRFFRKLHEIFKRSDATTNITPLQQELLDTLPSDPTFLFPEADKGLGPCAVKFTQYIEDVLVHLCDKEIYEQLSEQEAALHTDLVHTRITDWLKRYKHVIGTHAHKFIEDHTKNNLSSPFGQFYILYKIHKGIGANGKWPTRPVSSDVTSLPHALGKWVTEALTPIQTVQPSYFKDSFELKTLLSTLKLPSTALLFTADAYSMYTNIKTDPALESIANHIRSNINSMGTNKKEALIEAMDIVFRNNLFKFGDTFWRQKSGTAMGTPPAPPYATIFFALHEHEIVPKWAQQVIFYKRFIDDVLGVWLPHPDPIHNEHLWKEFCSDMDKWHGLRWKCETPSRSVDFMDLTITIVNNRLETTLFEKAMNLYLYLPPHSSHPRGVFTGLIFGQVLRIRRLCTHKRDADKKVLEFFNRLLARGHTQESIGPLFDKAEANAQAYMRLTTTEKEKLKQQKETNAQNQVFLHLKFHPSDPQSREIQRIWREQVLQPEGETPLPEMENIDGVQVGLNKLVIAYSRPLNLKNRFSVRDIDGRGESVSKHLAQWS